MKTANIFKNIEYKATKPMITVLFETDFTKEIRIAMQNGTEMKEHKTPYPIVVEIVDGHIEFGVKNKVHSLDKGSIIALDGNVPHNLKAKKDSIVRLTLTKNDDAKRVKNVIHK